MAASDSESWTVVDDDGFVVDAVEDYLAIWSPSNGHRPRCGLMRSA